MKSIRQNSISAEIRKIRRAFLNIAQAFDRLGPALAEASRPAPEIGGGAAKSGRRRPRLSAAQRRALKLQGKYMGTMRGLKAAAQARVKAIRKTKGIRAAIAEAQRLARR